MDAPGGVAPGGVGGRPRWGGPVGHTIVSVHKVIIMKCLLGGANEHDCACSLLSSAFLTTQFAEFL